MLGGLGFWGVSFGGAFLPWILRAILYPNHAGAAGVELVPADALGPPFLWSLFVVWSISWAFVVGYAASAWAGRQARQEWASRALLLLSLASPLAFAFGISVLLRLATRDAWHANGALPYLPAVLLQLVVSHSYTVMVGLRLRAGLPRGEGA
jgi:hypothetical protein